LIHRLEDSKTNRLEDSLSRRRPAVLYVVHRVPYPPDKGDRIRGYHLLRHLADRADVHLACLADEDVSAETLAALERLCARVAVIPVGRRSRWARAFASLATGGTISEGAFRAPALQRLLARWADEVPFRVALASSSSVAPYLTHGKLACLPLVVDMMDVDSEKWLAYAAASRPPLRWLYRLEGRRLRQLEIALGNNSRAVTVVSDSEADLFRRFGPPGAIHAVPNGVDLEYFSPTVEQGEGCVFVGALDYLPNVDAVTWFCKEAWPEILRRRPGTTLRLVGRKPKPEVLRLSEQEGVEVVGQVPDVRPFVRSAAVAVAPLRIARGIQNKILEAMALARTVICSPQARAGLKRSPAPPVRVAGTAQEWAAEVVSLLNAPDERQRLGEEGRCYVETHHDWNGCLAPLAALLDLDTLPSAAQRMPVTAEEGEPEVRR
jgi:sugar transferase (PEP-CTERM/EpsH1 system associated)